MKRLWRFYTKSWFYTLLFFVSLFVTASPWFYEVDETGSLWWVRWGVLVIYAGLNVSAYFLVKSSEETEETFKGI